MSRLIVLSNGILLSLLTQGSGTSQCMDQQMDGRYIRKFQIVCVFKGLSQKLGNPATDII